MLKLIHLKNICQHADMVVELGAGLTVVVGPQGSGKTNLFLMGLASVMGELPLHGVKKDNVRRGAEAEQAYIRTQWRSQGRDIELIRGYNKKGSSIAVDGQILESHRRESEMTTEMLGLLGVEKSAIWDFCFVPQGQTDGLLQAGGTDRIRFMSRFLNQPWLLDLEEKVKEAQAEVKSQLTHDYREELSQNWLGNRRAMVESAEAAKVVADMQLQLQQVEQQLHALGDIASLAARLENAKLEHTQALAEQQRHMTRKSICQQELESLPGELLSKRRLIAESDRWAAVVVANKAYDDVNTRVQEVTEELEEAEYALQQPPPQLAGAESMDVPAVTQLVEKMSASITEKQVERQTLLQQLGWYRKGTRVCGECGTHVEVLPGQVDSVIEKGKAVSATITTLQQQLQLCQTHITQMAIYESRRSDLQEAVLRLGAELAQLTQRLGELVYMPIPEGSQWKTGNALAELRREVEKLAIREGKLQTEVQHLDEGIARVIALEAKLTAEITELSKQVQEEAVQTYNRLNSQRVSLSTSLTEWRSVQIQRHTQATSYGERVKLLLAEVRKQRNLLKAEDLLQELYPHLRPKGLPADVLASMLRGIAERMTQLCEELGQPFEVLVGDDLDFVIRHADGGLEQVRRLSAGQRACVATVFWLVRLTSQSSGSLPLLVLDEPTANMDAAAVAKFGEMLRTLGPMLTARGLQVVLITHHEQLLGCGQYVVRLGA